MNHDLAFEIDRHGVLRIPALFWVAMALLARHWVLMIVIIVTARRQSSAWALLGDGGLPWGWLLLEIPILLLVAAAFYRQPTAGAWARWLWRHGPWIVVLTVALNLGWTGKLLLESSYWTLWPELFLASCCVLDLAIALAMTTTPYYRQMFAEFPARPEADARAA
jgi:hypothetical protein